jgi:hypothetical protein
MWYGDIQSGLAARFLGLIIFVLLQHLHQILFSLLTILVFFRQLLYIQTQEFVLLLQNRIFLIQIQAGRSLDPTIPFVKTRLSSITKNPQNPAPNPKNFHPTKKKFRFQYFSLAPNPIKLTKILVIKSKHNFSMRLRLSPLLRLTCSIST